MAIDYSSRSPAIYPDNATLGEYAGVRQVNKFAFRNVLNSADGLALLSGDDSLNQYTILSAPTAFNIVYDNTVDGFGTNGALILAFDYLDENLERKEAVHVLSNTGSDQTPFVGLGINAVTVVASGLNQKNANNISINAVSDGSTQCYIRTNESQSNFGVIHVPINEKLIAKYIVISGFKEVGGTTPIINFVFEIFNRFTNTSYAVGKTFIDPDASSYYYQEDQASVLVGPGSIVILKASSTTSNSSVSIGVTHLFYENP